MSGNLRVFLEQLESLGNRISEAGKEFGTASTENAKSGHETESKGRTFGDDKIGAAMKKQYDPNTASTLGAAGQDTGAKIADLGAYMVQTAAELRVGENANETQHRSTETK
ncbi:hypothetical protein [Allokutzneria sp. NRRL B-24872]|uniref:hypothetical protein n=1 Tax=Allokutzneria sp. NRRL B-24872 TaxID=1137961 RepID=UPI000A389603|nr:hypothetical protein [Allokutzneria sp. NRRL B-24872]